jgi:hypothetical protein
MRVVRPVIETGYSKRWPSFATPCKRQAQELHFLRDLADALLACKSCCQEQTLNYDHLQVCTVSACRYENIVQIRCLLEGVDTDQMLEKWHVMLPQSMVEC